MTTHNNFVGAQLGARAPSHTLPRKRGRASVARGAQRTAGALALAALFLAAPNAVLAQNECGAQVGTTPVDCGDATYASGVTYDAIGDLFIEFTNTPASTISGDGITLTGDGVESIDFDSATTETELRSNNGTSGPLLGITTVDGDIVIDAEEVDADTANVTRAIYAESTGSGSIDITTSGDVDAQSGANPADSIGIEAVTGSGSLTITSDSSGVLGNEAAIDATTGSGLLTVNIIGSEAASNDRINGGIRVNTGGSAVVNIASERSVTGGMQAAGSGTLILNNDGEIQGVLDFSSLNGGYTFNHNAGATWNASPDLSGADASDLGAGALNNAGTIVLGRGDTISAPGTAYTSVADNGVLLMDSAILDGRSSLDCAAPTIAGCVDLTGGATAGQTTILIQTANNNTDPFAETIDKPVNAGVVLVDVGGGTSAAGHFVLDPSSSKRIGSGEFASIYAEDPVYGAVLDTGGLFDYALLYNPENQQHVLTSVPQHEALEYAALIHESLSVWHTTSDAVAGRQADLRDGGQRGVWVRVFTDKTERDFKPTVTTHGNTFTYDRGYDLDTRGVIAGYDLTADDDGHVLGVHLGFMSTRLDHDDSRTKDETTFPSSVTFGVYGGWWNETGLTLDGTLNVNLLDIEHDVRDGLEDTRTNVITAGIRAEAGWRFPLSEAFYVQPLATAAYAYADVERLDLRDYDAKFEDEQSMRAALGVRLGGDMALNGDKVGKLAYWLTARAWEEYAEDGNVQFATGGDPLIIEDDISEGFEEVGLGVSLTSPDESLEVFLSGNIRSGDQTDGNNVTVGARLNW